MLVVVYSSSVQLRRAQKMPRQGAREVPRQCQGEPRNKGISCLSLSAVFVLVFCAVF